MASGPPLPARDPSFKGQLHVPRKQPGAVGSIVIRVKARPGVECDIPTRVLQLYSHSTSPVNISRLTVWPLRGP